MYVVSKEERPNHTSIANQPYPYSYLVTVIKSLVLKVYGLLTTGTVLSNVVGIDMGIECKSCFISDKHVLEKSRWSVQKVLAKPFSPLVITRKQLMVPYHLERVKLQIQPCDPIEGRR